MNTHTYSYYIPLIEKQHESEQSAKGSAKVQQHQDPDHGVKAVPPLLHFALLPL